MSEVTIAVFLIAHGLVHSLLAIAPDPGDPAAKAGAFFTAANRSWLLPQLNLDGTAVQRIGIILVGLSTAGFVLAGVGILGVSGLAALWRPLAVLSAAVSLLLLGLFWHPWLPVGVLIDGGVLASMLLFSWPPANMFGG